MKKINKILIILLIPFIILSTNAMATTAGEIKNTSDNWVENGSKNSPMSSQKIWDELIPIGQVMLAIGAVVLVVAFMWLGIKYMTTDPSGKADVKQRLVGLIIATVVIFGGVGIFTLVVNLMNGILFNI